MAARRCVFVGALFAVVGLSLAASAWSANQPTGAGPNFIVVVTDDYAWPYYGFMQRYLRGKQEAVEHGRAYSNDEEIAVSSAKFRFGLLLPDDASRDTPPLQDFLTPAMDSLAGGDYGTFFPNAHLGASICQPGLATAMTGLHLADANRNAKGTSKNNNDGTAQSSPVIPELLLNFAWDPAENDPKLPEVASDPDQYLTMGAGKWRLNDTTHKFDDTDEDDLPDVINDCGVDEEDPNPKDPDPDYCDDDPENKNPFDRQLTTGGDSAGARKILLDSLRETKDFIDCARCMRICEPTGAPCGADGDAACDDADCKIPACDQPTVGFDDDGPRMEAWRDTIDNGGCDPDDDPRSFLIVFNPFIPHEPLDETICTDEFRRDYGQATAENGDCDQAIADNPSDLANNSVYCRTDDPHPVATLNRCQPAGDPCCPAGEEGVPDTGSRCGGDACVDDTDCTESGETCRPIDLSCDCVDAMLEEIGYNLENHPETAVSDKNIYMGASTQFTRKGNYLRFLNAADRTVDELRSHVIERDLLDQTIFLILTDNGATFLDMQNSKGRFGEHGYRTPFVLYDESSTNPVTPDADCGGVVGCRSEYVQFPDLMGTILAAQLSYGVSETEAPEIHPRSLRFDTVGKTDPAYEDMRDLREPAATFVKRDCAPFMTAAGVTADTGVTWKQCMFGLERAGSNPQSTKPGNGWYVLAEIEDGDGVIHHCKYYHENAGGERLFDLTCDPNERFDLARTTGGTHNYPEEGLDGDDEYCFAHTCDNSASTITAVSDLDGIGCADHVDCGGTCRQLCEDSTTGFRDVASECTMNGDCENFGCLPILGKCEEGPRAGIACSVDADCNGVCGTQQCYGGPADGESCSVGDCGGTCKVEAGADDLSVWSSESAAFCKGEPKAGGGRERWCKLETLLFQTIQDFGWPGVGPNESPWDELDQHACG